VIEAARAALRRLLSRTTGRRPGAPPPTDPGAPPPTDPGDEPSRFAVEYRPHPDGLPDPGEVVWAWVPYEDDRTRGKDRPVLIMGRRDPWLLGLMLTSKDHDRDAAREAAVGRSWMDLGTGSWDRQGRPSEVRLDRVLRLDPGRVRREGATLDHVRFSAVVAAMESALGWQR
jgi:hypothetical protein